MLETRHPRGGNGTVDCDLAAAVLTRVAVGLSQLVDRPLEEGLDPLDLLRGAGRLLVLSEEQRQHRLDRARLAAWTKLDVHPQQRVPALLEIVRHLVEPPGLVPGRDRLEDLLARQDSELGVPLLERLVITGGDLDAKGIRGPNRMQPEQHFGRLLHNAPPPGGECFLCYVTMLPKLTGNNTLEREKCQDLPGGIVIGLAKKSCFPRAILRNMAGFLKIALGLPQKHGVYVFHATDDTVIYVGKANNLRSRVSSYFRKSTDLTPAKTIMLTEIKRIEHIIVRSETEALLLESTLIKKYRPKYNIILKDDKYFQYIKIALREKFPQVSTVRRVTIDGSRYFGPYTSGLAVRRTMRLLKRLFPYKSCNNKPEIPCFDSHLGRCLGHDTGPGSVERYHQVIERLIYFLEGKTGQVLKQLRIDMKTASQQRDFEYAALLRDRLQALEHVIEQQTVVTPKRDSFDVIGLARLDGLAAVNLFQVRQGKLVQRDQFMLQNTKDQSDRDVIRAFTEQFYSQSTTHPKLVIVPVDLPLELGNALQLEFRHATRGMKRKLLSMATENAEDYLQREQNNWLSAEAKARLGLQELAHALNLDEPPKRIEMYDISNFQGKHPVGSMVVFEQGLPKKSDYRKFAIRDKEIPDDMRRLAEVIRRRFAHHGHSDSPPLGGGVWGGAEKDGWPMPDLLILDGGKPQLSVVIKHVPGLTEHVPVVALAKEREEIFIPGRSSPIRLPEGSQELFLIQRIRDEAHRFAIGYYRKVHRRETTRSVLDEIPGLGADAKQQLLREFGTLNNIRAASAQDLEKTIGKKKSELLLNYL